MVIWNRPRQTPWTKVDESGCGFFSPQDKGICLLIYHALLFAPGLRDVVYSCPMSLAHHLFPNLFLPADQTLHKIPSYYFLILIIPCNQTRGIHIYTITTFYRMVCSQYINCQQWKLFGPKTANYHFLHRVVTTTYLQRGMSSTETVVILLENSHFDLLETNLGASQESFNLTNNNPSNIWSVQEVHLQMFSNQYMMAVHVSRLVSWWALRKALNDRSAEMRVNFKTICPRARKCY